MDFLVGLGMGIAIALLVGAVMKRLYVDKLNMLLNLDWDMDGESGELITKIQDGTVADMIKKSVDYIRVLKK